MPSRRHILEGLFAAANQGFAYAIAWHALFALALACVAFGWRPSHRSAGVLLAAPLASVGVASFVFGNAFNGVTFIVLALAFVALSAGEGTPAPIRRGPWWSTIVGVVLFVFGWAYPHFLVDRSPLAYAIGAPLGLVPCATLAAVSGVVLMLHGLENRSLARTLALAAAFYGVFGVVRLGVVLDVALLVAAASLFLCSPWSKRAPKRPRRNAPVPGRA